MDVSLSITGFIVGIFVGMVGVGGASLMTPILIYLGISPVKAIGTDLVYNAVTKFFGSIQHLRQKTVRLNIVYYLSMGSIPGAILAVLLVRWIDINVSQTDLLLKNVLGVILLSTALLAIIQEIRNKKGSRVYKWRNISEQKKKVVTVVLGIILGFVVGFTSIGSGTLFALALYYLYSIPGKDLVGTDIIHAFLLTGSASLFYFYFGHVDYLLLFQLLLGSIPGVILGSMLAPKFSSKFLRYLVLTIVMISGLMLLLDK
jgi:uncharacterized membrane protein YfcA